MSQPIPPGRENLIPHLVCRSATEAIAFYQQAFGAEQVACMMAPDGERVMHAEVTIDGMAVYLADEFPEYCPNGSRSPQTLGGSCVSIHRYVTDVDAVVQRAIDAGATAKMPVMDMFWGDRYGTVIDPSGHTWSFATHVRDMTADEMHAAMIEAFSQADQQAANG